MQGWDFRLGINGIKRMQAAYNSTLVAQGAFSAYWTEDLRAVGGWPDAIGEDIVLTWSIMAERGHRIRALRTRGDCRPRRARAFIASARAGPRECSRASEQPAPDQPRFLAKVVSGAITSSPSSTSAMSSSGSPA